ncbi:MAG: hypothetical protein GYA51_09765 [Candidatus Methanofastidiosa archaeon]|jgi:hypothetical protein|nr:hypothetical protein [Candidatus Methanofastidiosa archaeon]
MKAGSFNIHEYLGKLYDKVNEEDLTKSLSLNEEEKAGNLPDDNGMIIPEEGKKAYDWLKKEYHKGKTEVKVEMSYHEFKPGYHLDTNLKSVNDFKPGLYGDIKTKDTEGGKREKAVPFPETKFPGGETKASEEGKKENESSEKKSTGITVEAKPKVEAKAKKEDQEIGKEVKEDTKDKVVKK